VKWQCLDDVSRPDWEKLLFEVIWSDFNIATRSLLESLSIFGWRFLQCLSSVSVNTEEQWRRDCVACHFKMIAIIRRMITVWTTNRTTGVFCSPSMRIISTDCINCQLLSRSSRLCSQPFNIARMSPTHDRFACNKVVNMYCHIEGQLLPSFYTVRKMETPTRRRISVKS